MTRLWGNGRCDGADVEGGGWAGEVFPDVGGDGGVGGAEGVVVGRFRGVGRCRCAWERLDRCGGDGALVVGAGHEAGVEEDGGIVLVVDLIGEAFRGQVDGNRVEQVGGGAEVADDLLFLLLGNGLQALAVEDGELEAEEEGVGALGLDEVAGEGVDHLGEGEHDRDTVFERGQGDDVAALHEALGADHAVAVDGVALVEAAVEVAEVLVRERDGVALDAVGADVAAKIDVHDGSPLFPRYPPRGGVGGWWFNRVDAAS